jgi:hypothetical protein
VFGAYEMKNVGVALILALLVTSSGLEGLNFVQSTSGFLTATN